VFFCKFLVTSTITLSIFVPTSINDHVICEKSNLPNSNDILGSNLELYINGYNLTSSRYVAAEIDQILNVTVYFTDSSDDSFISNANISLTGVLNDNFTENVILEHYNVSIRINNLNFGIHFFTIFAQKQEYESQSIVFTIEVKKKESNLQLFLNGDNETIGKYVEATIGDLVNVTVIYEDYSKLFIDNAEVIIVGEGIDFNLTQHPIYDQYNVSIDSDDLNFGINLLTFYAQKVNYQPQTIQIIIEVGEIVTNMNVFLNGINKTIDPSISIPIRKMLNITVIYLDIEHGNPITGATIQIVGEGFLLNLTENLLNHQYSIFINTSMLYLGVKILTVFCTKANYQFCSTDLRIEVARIRTNISTISGEIVFNLKGGDDYLLQIQLTDLESNVKILKATVTYTWAYGQGTLTDPEDDGIYEGTISNLVEGIFVINISVYAGDDYKFERFTITLNIVQPPQVVLLSSDADNPDLDGTFDLIWTSSEHADNYSIYVYNRYITEINSSVVLLKDQIGISPYLISGLLDGTYYYVVVAFNEYGNTSSNCIQVMVSGSIDEIIIPGYSLFILICIISIFSVIIIQRQLRHKNKRSKITLRDLC